MDKWDFRFLRLARHISTWSKDPSTKVGCVITSGKKVISLGYNGFPKVMLDDYRLKDRLIKHDYVIHAEENALLTAGTILNGCTAYVWPLNPCTRCAAKLIQAGITRVVANRPSHKHSERYPLEQVTELFSECNIQFDIVDLL